MSVWKESASHSSIHKFRLILYVQEETKMRTWSKLWRESTNTLSTLVQRYLLVQIVCLEREQAEESALLITLLWFFLNTRFIDVELTVMVWPYSYWTQVSCSGNSQCLVLFFTPKCVLFCPSILIVKNIHRVCPKQVNSISSFLFCLLNHRF